ncbi:hypothetical protein [Tenacibaculum haliotis]|uniref:hypothetical protein n=1 Tax=Tenacibaculum haliotis TaxID=1888914 RepID=UPI0021AF4214|nr:hypothetical protein [Tenacibaculum haliotis]MCT4698221.1 hypothetical protein [Tenacibaculum haliotis]
MKYLPLLIILTCLNIFGQKKAPNKENTQEWIKSVLNSYSGSVIEFGNEKMTDFQYADTSLCKEEFGGTTIYINTVLIKNISNIIIRKQIDSDNYLMIFSCNKGNCFKEGVNICSKNRTDNSINYSYTSNKLVIKLSQSIKNDELDKRLIKAYKHLINLYGGKTIDETF